MDAGEPSFSYTRRLMKSKHGGGLLCFGNNSLTTELFAKETTRCSAVDKMHGRQIDMTGRVDMKCNDVVKFQNCLNIAYSSIQPLYNKLTTRNAPNIEVSHNMRVLKLPRETKAGTIIYRLKGHDFDIPDVLTFGIRGTGASDLLDVQAASFTEADVILRKRPTENEYKFTVFVTDGVQTTEDESTIIITDVTRLSSPFLDYEPVIQLPENTAQNTTVGYVLAREKENSNLPVQFELRGSEKFSIKYVFGPRGTSKAEINVIQTVDYERRNMYRLQILALNAWTNETVDTRNIAVVDIVVTVEDVQDTPPVFMDLPSLVKLSESLRPGDKVLRVRAVDGDFGNQRSISYSFLPDAPWNSFFTINSSSGEITLAKPINELRQQYGAAIPLLLGLQAREISLSGTSPLETTAEVALLLVDTENHPPKFANTRYVGTIGEGSPALTAVHWGGATIARVTDDDQGKNGSFRLFLDGDADTFEVQPSSGANQLDFAILVKHPAGIDYESNDRKYLDFRLVVRETQASIPLSATAEVRVTILDTNDNIPQFKKLRYEASVSENADPGTFVTKIETFILSKTYIFYLCPNSLILNSETGVITLRTLEGMDRERVPEYTLIVETRDNLGRGNKNVVELLLHLVDANDNVPTFLQPRYDAVLNTDMKTFNQRLIVKAFDADETGPNSKVTYEIVSGNYQDKFRINPISGEITLKEPLVEVNRQGDLNNDKLPPITLNVRAHDHGVPVQSSTVEIRVHNQEYLNRTISFIIPLPVEGVLDRKDEIETSFNTLTGARVNIYSVRPHNDSQVRSVASAWVAYPLNSMIDVMNMKNAI
ncbi:cadherin-86C-like, partial [Limulus polyphemus]|uniref:Cadherin-86C-like n=1 Tax=Limulus polyphemus TaxID=6850 RepID=A0ABM1TL26_LIMPO